MLTRRELLWRSGGGLAGVALAKLLADDGALGARQHHPARARRVVQVFLSGAASQCDTFDYKPLLAARAGEPFDPGGRVELFQSDPGAVMPSPWAFRRHGECGHFVSDLLPHIATCADELAVLLGMTSATNVHGPATFLQATGFERAGFPSAGAWISYGLGSASADLPAFVCLPDARGLPPNGPRNWGAGFLPAEHQATELRPLEREPLRALRAPEGSFPTRESEVAGLELRRRLDERHRDARPGDDRLYARIRSYELAARMQVSAPEALELSGESPATRALYGLDEEPTRDMGTRCLLARRLLERGVRFVQVWSGADNGFPRRNWDSHEELERDHGRMALEMDRPVAALIRDLRARGLLDDTVVLWTTEFGRMPCAQGSAGRDHNPHGFATFLAGGGVRGGATHGATDEWSFRAVEGKTTVHDVHATLLHLLGLDHEQLVVRNDGIDRRLTDVHGNVLRKILD